MSETHFDKATHTRYLQFSLGGEQYAVPLLAVREVIAVPETTPVPFTPPHFRGIINLRGEVMAVMDLRLKMGAKPTAGQENAVIVCNFSEGVTLGLQVDSINSVIAPDPSQLAPKPAIETSRSIEFISGVFKLSQKLVFLVDTTRLLTQVEQAAALQASRPSGRAA